MQLNNGEMRPTGDIITDRLDTGPLQLPHLGQLLLDEVGQMFNGNLTQIGLANLQACSSQTSLQSTPLLAFVVAKPSMQLEARLFADLVARSP